MDDECSKAARRKFMGTSNGARLIKATRSRVDLERVMMEPLVRFELTTVRLQGGCSTTELKRHGNEVAHIYRRWPVVASRKWIVRHGYFHFKRLKTFQESNREPCSSGGSADGSSECGAVSGCSVSAEGAGEPSVRSAVAEGAVVGPSVSSFPDLAGGMMRETRSTGCLVMIFPWAPRFLILRSAKWKGLIRLRSFRTAFR